MRGSTVDYQSPVIVLRLELSGQFQLPSVPSIVIKSSHPIESIQVSKAISDCRPVLPHRAWNASTIKVPEASMPCMLGEDKESAPEGILRATALALASLLRVRQPDLPHKAASEFTERISTTTCDMSEIAQPSKATINAVKAQIYQLLQHLVKKIRISSACLVHMLVLVERAIRADVPFRIDTWYAIVLSALVLAVKTFYDEDVTTNDFMRALAFSSHPAVRFVLPTAELALLIRVLRFEVDVCEKTYQAYSRELFKLAGRL